MSHPADVLELEVSPGENDEIDPKTPEPEVNSADNSSKLQQPEAFTTPEVEKKPEMKEEEQALANSRVLWITGDLERTMKANDFRVAFSPFGRGMTHH